MLKRGEERLGAMGGKDWGLRIMDVLSTIPHCGFSKLTRVVFLVANLTLDQL